MKSKFLLTYDISETKIRTKVANILSKLGKRVQYSCFEVECTEKELRELSARLKKEIDPTTDSVFFFPITKNMEKAVVEIGVKREGGLLL